MDFINGTAAGSAKTACHKITFCIGICSIGNNGIACVYSCYGHLTDRKADKTARRNGTVQHTGQTDGSHVSRNAAHIIAVSHNRFEMVQIIFTAVFFCERVHFPIGELIHIFR